MNAHEPDWVSAGFGALFTLMGLIFITTRIRWERFDGAAFAWVGLIAIGLVIVGTTVRKLRIEE